jgi:hypothetical protein
MIRILTILFGSFCFLLSLNTLADEKKPDPREKVETALAEAIRLLEAKDYTTVIKNFAPPEVLEKMTKEKSLEEVAKGFGEGKGPRLLKVLKATKDVKPKLNNAGDKATFELPEEVNSKKSVSFIKVGKYWYITD